MRFSLPKPKMVIEAGLQSRSHPLAIELLIWVAVFLVAGLILEGILQMVAIIPAILASDTYRGIVQGMAQGSPLDLAKINELTLEVTAGPAAMLAMLFSTVGMIGGVIIYVRAIEGRKLATMGFRRSHALREYLGGLVFGIVIFSAAIGISVVTGAISYEGFVLGSAGLLALFFVGFLIQGLSEEMLCRGYLMVSLARRQRLWLAVVVSSVLFAALHLGNSGIFSTPFTLINLAGFGALAGIYILKRGNIWGAAALHSIWNFMQGNFYGLPVSGGGRMETVFAFTPSQEGFAPLINGGAFGPEGGLAVSVVLAIGIVALLLMKPNPAEQQNEVFASHFDKTTNRPL